MLGVKTRALSTLGHTPLQGLLLVSESWTPDESLGFGGVHPGFLEITRQARLQGKTVTWQGIVTFLYNKPKTLQYKIPFTIIPKKINKI